MFEVLQLDSWNDSPLSLYSLLCFVGICQKHGQICFCILICLVNACFPCISLWGMLRDNFCT